MVYVLIFASAAVVWCLTQHFFKTYQPTMAPIGKSASHNGAGPSSRPSATTPRTTYADIVRSTRLFGSRRQLKLRNEKLQASRMQFFKRAQSAAHQVFNTPELLALILSELPLESNRNAMFVSKLFWQCTRPDADEPLSGINEALGLKFSRSIESMSDWEKGDFWGHKCPPHGLHGPHMDWLLNIQFDCACMLDQKLPFLKIKPFTLASIKGNILNETLKIKLKLDAEHIKNAMEWRGVGALRQGQQKLYSNRTYNGVRHNWMDVKIVKMPFSVRVCVAIDFRRSMGAPSHQPGQCPIHGCQVGLHGVQVRAFRTHGIPSPYGH